MGDRKSSHFLRHLKSLLPDVPEDFLRRIWSSMLPTHIQTILAEGTLDAAKQLGDRIVEVAPLPTTVSVAQAPDSANLLKRIDYLSRQVYELTSDRTRQ
jgi:hypothetical protein